jgi:hypothetical protein
MIVVLFYIVPLKELESQPMRRGRTLMFLQILCNQEKTLTHQLQSCVFEFKSGAILPISYEFMSTNQDLIRKGFNI